MLDLDPQWKQCGSETLVLSSVADPGCLSRMFIPDPDFCPSGSRISDLKTATKERGEKKFVVVPFLEVKKITKLKIILILNWWRKNFGPVYKELKELSNQKIVIRLSKVWVWDPGSEIRDPEKTYSGSWSRGQKGTWSRIRIRNTGCK